MSFVQAAFLGIVQGLTEFLPISSSGHLVIMQSLIKDFSQIGISFDIFLHFATLLSVIIYFRKDIEDILLLRNRKWIYLIFVASVPAGIVGVFLKNWIEHLFSNPVFVGVALLITGTFLFLSDRVKKTFKSDDSITVFDSFIIGCAQAFAIFPGISRSGATITASLFCGLKRDVAVRFSFIMSIPAIGGAFLLSLKDLKRVSPDMYSPYLCGGAFAFFTGLLSLRILEKMTKIKSLKFFSFYCWVVGIISIAFFGR